MEIFFIYLRLGFDHITDLNGYDHILFIITLCSIYSLKDWKNILYLVSFFTIGHTITLALSALQIVKVNADFIELLIPITILITCLNNIYLVKKNTDFVTQTNNKLKFALTLFFGFIHGLGFSNYLKSLLGITTNIITELFAFNLGLEIGQLLIVLIFMLISFVILNKLKIKLSYYYYTISLFTAIISLYLIVNKLNF